MVEEKACFTCKKVKPYSEFGKRNAGKLRLTSNCKKCASSRAKERSKLPHIAEKLPKQRSEGRIRAIERNTNMQSFLYSEENLSSEKKCTRCSETKTKNEFVKELSRKDGFQSVCASCLNAQNRIRYHNNHSVKLEKGREYQRKNPDLYRKAALNYYYRNVEDCRTRNKKWLLENNDLNLARYNKRRTAKLKAIPPWADLDKIKELYAESDRLTKETGVRHSVDHIVPLQGKNVSGFHVHYNLRVIPLRDNVSKGNRLIEELVNA